jgi:hypothetical protein
MNISLFSPFILFMAMSAAMSIIDLFIPYDTLGRELDV